MKFKYFNKELTKKVLAGTIAGIITLSGVPSIAKSNTNNSTNTSTSISSNACYDEYIGEVDTLGGKFKIYKRENSVYAEHIGEKFTDKITVFNDGTVSTSITRRDKNGVSTTSTESFKINSYTGDYIDIETYCINDPDMKKCLNSFKNYINGINFNETNYIKELNYCPNREYYEKAQKQVKAAAQKMDNDINISEMKYGVVFVLPGESATLSTGEMLTATGMITATATAMQNLKDLSLDYYNKSIIGTKISVSYLTLRLYMEIVAQNISKALDNLPNTDSTDYGDFTDVAIMYPESLGNEETPTINVNMLAAGAGWMSLAESMNLVIKNVNDYDPNNDYFKTIVDRDSNVLFINIFNPLSIDEAASELSEYKNFNGEIINPYNIYTYKAKDARAVIEKSGGIPGLGNDRPESKYAAENHAFVQSYKNFNKDSCSINPAGYSIKLTQKPGIYYWHYHYYGKVLLNGKDNPKHIFFGTPVIITQNDINKYAGKGEFKLSDLELFETMQVPYDYDKMLNRAVKFIGSPYNQMINYEDRKTYLKQRGNK